MQQTFIFSSVSSNPFQSPLPSAPAVRSDAQYGNEIRYLRKIMHTSLHQEQRGVIAAHREGEFDELRVA